MPKSKKIVTLTDKDESALKILKRLRFLNCNHLAYWLNVSATQAYRRIKRLMDAQLVIEYKEQRPFVYCLSKSGTARMRVQYQSRWYSAPSMHQYLMCNEFEIFYRKSHQRDFFCLDRNKVKRFGLNCAVAERPYKYLENERASLGLLVIDDYLMSPDRPGFILDRLHKTDNNIEYHNHIRTTSGRVIIPRWRNAISQLIVVTTNKTQIPLFNQSFEQKPLNIKNKLFLMPPIWSIA